MNLQQNSFLTILNVIDYIAQVVPARQSQLFLIGESMACMYDVGSIVKDCCKQTPIISFFFFFSQKKTPFISYKILETRVLYTIMQGHYSSILCECSLTPIISLFGKDQGNDNFFHSSIEHEVETTLTYFCISNVQNKHIQYIIIKVLVLIKGTNNKSKNQISISDLS